MATALATRVTDLERWLGVGGCEVCGDGGDGPVTFVLVTDPDRPEREPCPACGRRPRAFTLRIGEMKWPREP